MRLRYNRYVLGRGVQKLKSRALLAVSATMLLVSGSGAAFAVLGTTHADSLNVDFETPAYVVGNINNQQGWKKTGSYDVAVANVADYTNASAFGFGTQALRLSNAVTSGAFGDQTFSPTLMEPVGESQSNKYFETSFNIGSTQATQQAGLFMSVSPDDGNGSRMSYVGFDDQGDGIHVIFYDVTDNGPLGATANFNETDVATIDRTQAHAIKLTVETVPGAANDIVNLYVDGVLKHTGASWEDYYRYDPEQAGNGNNVPSISNVLFREGGPAAPGTAGNGYLVDSFVQLSKNAASNAPLSKDQCKKDGWKNFNSPSFKNQGQCVSFVERTKHL